MIKLKQLFNQIEEKILFPFGRKTWQILSVITILVLLLGVIWFIINSRPSMPVRVKVDRWEVLENEIDTSEYLAQNISNCKKEMIQTSLDTLKKSLPMLEWDSLGGIETKSYNLKDRYGNNVYIKNSWIPQKGQKQVYIINESAVPNLLNKIYLSRYIDSSNYCDRLQIISTIQLLVNLYDPKFLQTEKRFKDLCTQFEYYRKLDEYTVLTALSIYRIIDNRFLLIFDNESLRRFYQILKYVLTRNINDEKLVLAKEVITAHRNLGIYDENTVEEYYMTIKLIQSSAINDSKNIKRAINDFNSEIKFYHDIGFLKSLRRYLNLYENKLAWKENQKIIHQQLKAENRTFALLITGISLIIICILTVILLLFSIQNILQKNGTAK
jgi:hypothetical protein